MPDGRIAMPGSASQQIWGWLQSRLSEEDRAWLDGLLARAPKFEPHQLSLALAQTGRRLGRAGLDLTEEERAAAAAARPGWNPAGWSLDEASRILLLLASGEEAGRFGETLRRLCQRADLRELIGYYRGLPLYPWDDDVDWQAGEGLRTSVLDIFEAIAHRNPVPAERFDEHRWNHMVLKALFIGSSLQPILGLDERRNRRLAATLVDHVHERRAASRGVDLQVWRCLAPFAEKEVLEDLRPLLGSDDRGERLAAVLCLSESPDPRARGLMENVPEEAALVRSGKVAWDCLDA